MSDLARLVVVSDHAATALRLATREAVNKSSNLITADARRRVQGVLGSDQRMSGVIYRQRDGKRSVVRAETIAKGGTRINPYYRHADSTTNPNALVGVRGPAHYIEHPRRGGYVIRPVAKPAGPGAAGVLAKYLGYTPGEAAAAASRLTHPALHIPGTKGRASAKGRAITNPARPIGKAFDNAIRTIYAPATETIDAAMTEAWR